MGKSGKKWGRVSFALLSEVTMNRVDYISFSIRKRATFASVADFVAPLSYKAESDIELRGATA